MVASVHREDLGERIPKGKKKEQKLNPHCVSFSEAESIDCMPEAKSLSTGVSAMRSGKLEFQNA